jgi:hypothetical protein
MIDDPSYFTTQAEKQYLKRRLEDYERDNNNNKKPQPSYAVVDAVEGRLRI